IETVRGNIRGKLKDVKPDNLLIEDTVPYIVRIQQIVWIMPKQ
ncbi:YuzF family protein, partial [Bacillus cereus]|nr:YuzF family protein [Bacillus cereus]